MRFPPLLVLLVVAAEARADSVAYTCSAPANVKALTETGACTGFVAHDANGKQVQRVDKGFFVSGRILATPDGTTVAVLHDWPYSTKPFASYDALVFYRGGKPIATYKMPELVVRMDLVSVSTSHTNWVMRDTRPDNVLGKTLELVTTSQRVYEFDVATGKQTKADDTDDWRSCVWIVYAGERVPDPVNGTYTIAKPWFAKGAPVKPFVFTAAPKVSVGSGRTMCVDVKRVATKNLDVMFNLLPK
jgi:hypothetical protein